MHIPRSLHAHPRPLHRTVHVTAIPVIAASIAKDGLRILLPPLPAATVVVIAERTLSPVCRAIEARGSRVTVIRDAVQGEHGSLGRSV